jgi:hypothetical protein
VSNIGGCVGWNVFRAFCGRSRLFTDGLGAGVLGHQALLERLMLGRRLAGSRTRGEQSETEQAEADGDFRFHLFNLVMQAATGINPAAL